MLSYRCIFHLFGLVVIVLSGCLVAAGAWSAIQVLCGYDGERPAMVALLVVGGASLVAGVALWAGTRPCPGTLGRREAFLLVSLSWMAGALICALPYLVWAHISISERHEFHGIVNCYFESMSGLTTTGSSVIADVESLPASLLLWRAATHWLGGLGIVVLFVAVLPLLGASGKRLFRLETPGPVPEGVRPHIRETARILWLIYLGLTVAETLALRIAGLSWFDAVCQTFASLATGGFSTRNASIGGFGSFAVEAVIVVFVILAGANFALYYQMIRGRWREALRDTELRVYLVILAVASALVWLSVYNAGQTIVTTAGQAVTPTAANAARYAAFNVASIQTTTGFCTADFDLWPFLGRGVLIALMFIGGSAGSTAGGLKVIRIITCFKVLLAEIERAFRPNVIRPVKINRAVIEDDLKREALAFVLIAFALFLGAAALIMMLEPPERNCNFITAGTASIANLFNVGPGLGAVGAVRTYGWMTDGSKLVLSLLMVLGRLEVFPIAALLVPRFWRTA